MPASSCENENFCRPEGGARPFSCAQVWQTCSSELRLSWISVKCTVAGFLLQIWQTITRAPSPPGVLPGLFLGPKLARPMPKLPAAHCASQLQLFEHVPSPESRAARPAGRRSRDRDFLTARRPERGQDDSRSRAPPRRAAARRRKAATADAPIDR